jgi:hypothetical protein
MVPRTVDRCQHARATRCDAAEAARLWAESGAMALTGRADAAPSVAPAAIAVAATRWAGRLRALAADRGVALALDGPALLGERAACAGLARRGRISVGGRARLVRARDGWMAVNLPRPDDVASVPAWLEIDRVGPADVWEAVARHAATRDRAALLERARWLALAASAVVAPAVSAPTPIGVVRLAAPQRPRAGRAPLVADLSSLWAGPLCAQLLGAAGARVVKVESAQRPDGARAGDPAFFALLNGAKEPVVVDLAEPSGIAALRALLEEADLVVESARPRALRQLGIEAEAVVRARPGRTWVSMTGYGRADDRIAFGDDAAAAAGLAVLAGRDADGPLFCADAVADPLAGLCAAVAALEAWQEGGGVLLDVALRDVAAHAIAAAPAPARWDGPVAPPRARQLAT